MKHIMIDLETMGLGNRSALMAIGAVAMGERGEYRGGFYHAIDLQSSIDAGLRVDASTIIWWLQQSDDARAAVVASGAVPLRAALEEFSEWVAGLAGPPEPTGLWGNGAASDNVWLASAYAAVGMEPPWSYKADRCYRTFRKQHPDVPLSPMDGTAHNALHDARYQAAHMNRICVAKNITLS